MRQSTANDRDHKRCYSVQRRGLLGVGCMRATGRPRLLYHSLSYAASVFLLRKFSFSTSQTAVASAIIIDKKAQIQPSEANPVKPPTTWATKTRV
jgi:hypothetical protein